MGGVTAFCAPVFTVRRDFDYAEVIEISRRVYRGKFTAPKNGGQHNLGPL
jgi:hypothetical protein